MNPQPTIKQTHCSNNSVLIQHVHTTDGRYTNRTHPAQTINTLLWDTYSGCFICFIFLLGFLGIVFSVYWQCFSYAENTWLYQFCLWYLILKVKRDFITDLYVWFSVFKDCSTASPFNMTNNDNPRKFTSHWLVPVCVLQFHRVIIIFYSDLVHALSLPSYQLLATLSFVLWTVLVYYRQFTQEHSEYFKPWPVCLTHLNWGFMEDVSIKILSL